MTHLLRKKTFVVCVFLIVAILTSGCTSTIGNTGMAGKYVTDTRDTRYVELNSDGTCYYSGGSLHSAGKYVIKDNNLRCTLEQFGGYTVEFTISGKELINDNNHYIKQ